MVVLGEVVSCEYGDFLMEGSKCGHGGICTGVVSSGQRVEAP